MAKMLRQVIRWPPGYGSVWQRRQHNAAEPSFEGSLTTPSGEVYQVAVWKEWREDYRNWRLVLRLQTPEEVDRIRAEAATKHAKARSDGHHNSRR